MSPTPDEIKLGAQAYRRVRLHDKTEQQSRFAPWLVFVICAGLFIMAFVFQHHPFAKENFVAFLFIAFVFVMLSFQSRTEKSYLEQQKLLLRLLEEKYGDKLPWVAEENQLAAAAHIEEAARHSNQAA